MRDKNFPFWIFTCAVMVTLVLSMLIQDGMFMDGMLYACVAKNLSEGLGTFWHLHNTPFTHNLFDQQPPLGIGMQAVFFKLFGTGMYVERFYSFLTLCFGAFLIAKTWKQVFVAEEKVKRISWFPVLLWIIIPVCFWAYVNNMLECTMVIFDLLAVLLILKFFQRANFLLLVIAGVFIFLASLTKGFQGLFPLAAVFFYWLSYRSISFGKMIVYSLAPFAVVTAAYFLVFLNPAAKDGLMAYLDNRVLHSISSVSTVSSRFELLYRLPQELIPPGTIAVLVFLFLRKKTKMQRHHLRHTLFFLLVGISASFPLMITLEQRGFYLVTSLPFYAIAIACLNAAHVSEAIEQIDLQRTSFRIFRAVALLLLAGSLIFSGLQVGKAKRDKEKLHDVYLIGSVLPKGTMIGSSSDLYMNWSLQEYLVRHYYICISGQMTDRFDYILVDSQEKIPDELRTEKIDLPTIRYHLYKVIK